MSEAICKTKQGTGQKILTPKQMLQRLLIALGQQKACNQSNYKNGYYIYEHLKLKLDIILSF